MDVEYDQRKARWHVSLNFIEEAEDITEVALEWLFCSDNTLNMFGWYVTSDVQLGKILQMIGFGVVVQAVRSFLKHLSDRRRSSERLVVVSIVLDVFGWPRRSNGYSRFNWP